MKITYYSSFSCSACMKMKINNYLLFYPQILSCIRIELSNRMVPAGFKHVLSVFITFLPAIFLSLAAAPVPPVEIIPLQLPQFRMVHTAQGVGPLSVRVTDAATMALKSALNIPAVAFLRATRYFAVPYYSHNLSSITIQPAPTVLRGTLANVSRTLLSIGDVFQVGRQYTQFILGAGYEGPTSLRSLIYSDRSPLPAALGWAYIRWVHAAVDPSPTDTIRMQAPLSFEASAKYVRLMIPVSPRTVEGEGETVDNGVETNDVNTAKARGPPPVQSFTLTFGYLFPPTGADPLSVASGMYEISLRNKGGSTSPLPPPRPSPPADKDGGVVFRSYFKFQPLKSYVLTILLTGNKDNLQVLVVDETGATSMMTNEIA